MTADAKLLDRIRKLHAKAESCAAIGSDAEAQTFAAAVQKMLLKYKLSLSDLEMTRLEAEEPVGEQWTQSTKRHRVLWAERLAAAVAEAHFCRILVVRGSDAIILVGRETDRKIAEFVFTTLRRTAEELSDKEARRFRKQQRAIHGATLGRNENFREAWLAGFVHRISERYVAEMATARGSTGTALVRVDRATSAVTGYMAQRRGVSRSQSGPRRRATANDAGREAGRAAGDRVDIRGTGIGSGSGSQRTLGGGR